MKYLFLAGGREPRKWHLQPRPLWEPSEKETSENRYKDAQTDKMNIESGIYTADEARESRFGGDEYSHDIVLERDEDDDDARKPELGPEDLGELHTDPTEGDQPRPDADRVEEVTPQAITSATQVMKDVVSGAITIAAARVLLRKALRLEDDELDAMLEGVEEEQERRRERADKIAEGLGGGNEPPQPSRPGGKTPPPPPDDDEE